MDNVNNFRRDLVNNPSFYFRVGVKRMVQQRFCVCLSKRSYENTSSLYFSITSKIFSLWSIRMNILCHDCIDSANLSTLMKENFWFNTLDFTSQVKLINSLELYEIFEIQMRVFWSLKSSTTGWFISLLWCSFLCYNHINFMPHANFYYKSS